MTRLLVTQAIFPESLTELEGSSIVVDVRDSDEPMERADLIARLDGYDGVVCMLTDRIDAEVLAQNPQLKVVANVAVGFDNIDVAAADKLGIVVTNTPDVLTETTADLTLALILAVARRIPEADAFVRSGAWERWKLRPEQVGTDVHGKVLGLFGMGRIAKAVARRAALGFGMEVLYTARRELATDENDVGAARVELDELLERSDVLSLHAPLTPETRNVIGARELARMKDTAILINTARGPLVDAEAVADALDAGRLWGAGLDVFAQEPEVEASLLALRERVVLAPHIGSATVQARQQMSRKALTNARAVLEGRTPPNPVRL